MSRVVLNQCWDPRFLLNLVIGDEADFAMTGAVSTWNIREYAPQGNPSSFNYDWNISRHKVSVWCGLCSNGKNTGPYFWEKNVNTLLYLEVINMNIVPNLVILFTEQFQIEQFERIWWTQDSAPAYQQVAVTKTINRFFLTG